MFKVPVTMKFGAVVFATLLVVAFGLAGSGCGGWFGRSNGPSKILLVSIDTTRADHLSAYGYGRPTTPFLKRIAGRGVRVANAFAVMPTTDPSHTSILTGQYPRTHGIMRNAARRADPNAASLGTWLRDRGYRTAAITARIGLDPKLRLIAGFDHTDSPQLPTKSRNADEMVELASQWLAEQDGDWFLWVHLWEPHLPYAPPQPYRDRFSKKHMTNYDRYMEPDRFLRPEQTLSETLIERAKWLYDGEIAAADRALQKIVRAAYQAGPDHSPPLVMVVSDHGESMAERQDTRRIGFGHGVLLYNETVVVPWVTLWEGQLEPQVIETPVSLVDLAPSLMDLVDPGRGFQTEGRSIAAALHGQGEPSGRAFYLERRLFSPTELYADLGHPETGIVDYPWKLIENEAVGAPELYRLDRDPLEEVDLFLTQTAEARRLGEQLARWRDEHPLPRQSGAKARRDEQQQREREALRALGYID